MRVSIAIAAAAAIGLIAGSATTASASPLGGLQPLVHDGFVAADVTDVQYRHYGYGGYRHGFRGHHHAYGHRFHRRHFRDRGAIALGAGILGFALGAALAPRSYYYEPYPYGQYYAGPVAPYGYGWPDVEDPASGQDRHFQ